MVHIRKMQNITKVKVLEINKTILFTKVVVGGKRPDVSVRKV